MNLIHQPHPSLQYQQIKLILNQGLYRLRLLNFERYVKLASRSIQHNNSTSSSVRVVPPASRLGDTSGFDTPTEEQLSCSEGPQQVGTTQEFETSKIKSAELDDLYLTRPALSSSVMVADQTCLMRAHR